MQSSEFDYLTMASSSDLHISYFNSFEAHFFTPLGPINVTPIMFAMVVLLLLILSTLKALFGTISIPKIMYEYQDKAGIRKRYNELFQSRDGIRFHIAWAQSRGDNDEVNSMMKELKKIDKASLTNIS